MINVVLFASAVVAANVRESSNITQLVQQAKQAFTNKDQTETGRLLDIIYTKTTMRVSKGNRAFNDGSYVK